MHLIDTAAGRDPALHLALEEYLLRHVETGADTLLFYINARAVVIGRNQVPFAEAGLQALQRRRAVLLRRLSGGGTVYHDSGNLNFGWIQTRRGDPFPSPAEAVQPVLHGLRSLGLPVRLNQRHDILLGEGKITGIAQYRIKDKCLTHGTVLVSADLEALADVLRPDCDVPVSSGRPSVRSKVTNVTAHRPELTIAEVQAALIRAFTASHGPVSPLMLTSAAWAEIREAARTKYGSWDWTIGRSPVFSIRRRADFTWGRCEALVDIQRGRMVRMAFTLPDGAPPELARLAAHLQGGRYQPAAVARRVCSGAAALNLAVDGRALTEWLCPSWVWGH